METTVQVTLYHLPGCTRSEAVKAFIEEQGVCFQIVNVLTDPRAMTTTPSGARAPFPSVRVGARTILSATPDQVREALRQASIRPPA
jgi:glutaredoxin